jgi:hypothetical protein
MRLPDAIAPYAALIELVLTLALGSALFVGGCQRGESRQAGKVDAAKADRDQALAQVAKANAALQAVNAATAQNVAQAQAAKADAERQAQLAVASAAAAAARADKAAAALQAAKADPGCKAQLEMDLCASIPLL